MFLGTVSNIFALLTLVGIPCYCYMTVLLAFCANAESSNSASKRGERERAILCRIFIIVFSRKKMFLGPVSNKFAFPTNTGKFTLLLLYDCTFSFLC